jgi:hydrogenase maturation factor
MVIKTWPVYQVYSILDLDKKKSHVTNAATIVFATTGFEKKQYTSACTTSQSSKHKTTKYYYLILPLSQVFYNIPLYKIGKHRI